MQALLHHHRWRAFAALLLACVLVVRVAIPAGFMLMPTSGGALLVSCPAQGPTPAGAAMHNGAMHAMAMHDGAMAGHDAGKDQPAGHDKTGEHPCPFSAAGTAVDLAAIGHPAMPAQAGSGDAAPRPIAIRPGLGLAAPPPPKTGPPLLA